MPSKANTRPTHRRLHANLLRLARAIEALERSGNKDPRAWRQLESAVPALADCLTAAHQGKGKT